MLMALREVLQIFLNITFMHSIFSSLWEK